MHRRDAKRIETGTWGARLSPTAAQIIAELLPKARATQREGAGSLL